MFDNQIYSIQLEDYWILNGIVENTLRIYFFDDENEKILVCIERNNIIYAKDITTDFSEYLNLINSGESISDSVKLETTNEVNTLVNYVERNADNFENYEIGFYDKDSNNIFLDVDALDFVGISGIETMNFFFSYDAVYSMQYRYYKIEVEKNKLLYSANPTYDSNISQPFITKIAYYNNKGECVAVANLSSPVPTDANITFITETYQPII